MYTDDAVWRPALRAICARHRLDPTGARRALGAHVVFVAGARVVKLFCPLWLRDHAAEQAVLGHLRGLPAPEIVAEGELEGWPYLVLTTLPGRAAGEVWDDLDEGARDDVVRQLGALMRDLHRHPPLPQLATDWNAFLGERAAACERHHDVAEPWRSWIRERTADFVEPPFEPVLLSADLTEEHVLLVERGGRWRITGLIDFGDAMMGHPHYDFIAPLAFYTFGRPALSRALVESYGLALTPALAERLTTYCLLHKFARVGDFLRGRPVEDGPAFHRALWGKL